MAEGEQQASPGFLYWEKATNPLPYQVCNKPTCRKIVLYKKSALEPCPSLACSHPACKSLAAVFPQAPPLEIKHLDKNDGVL